MIYARSMFTISFVTKIYILQITMEKEMGGASTGKCIHT